MTKTNAQMIGKATIKAIRTIMKRTCSNKDVIMLSLPLDM